LNEIDKEVQEVNNKTQIKAIGRTGRFAQMQNDTNQAGPSQSAILPDGPYEKKLAMSVKPRKGGKLQGLELRAPPKHEPISPGDQQQELLRQTMSHENRPFQRPKTSTKRPKSNYRNKGLAAA
jgi:hypothetical protein